MRKMTAATSLTPLGKTAPTRRSLSRTASSKGSASIDDDMLSAVADLAQHWPPPQACVGFHTTTSSVSASSMIQCSDGNPTVVTAAGSDLSLMGLDLASGAFLFLKIDFSCRLT
jgi:hypothetical protein